MVVAAACLVSLIGALSILQNRISDPLQAFVAFVLLIPPEVWTGRRIMDRFGWARPAAILVVLVALVLVVVSRVDPIGPHPAD